jgi:hypothetical protein
LNTIKPIFQTPNNKHYFFGYYDKSPVNLDGTKHLALEVDFLDHLPNKDDLAVIGYFDIKLNNSIFHKLTETKTFNWQQGCMLQWFGDKNTNIIYNDLVDRKFVSIIMDINTKEKTILPMSIYSLSPSNEFALCIDYERHYWVRRSYGYDGVINSLKNKKIVENDGIFFLNIIKKKIKKIIDINEILKINSLNNMHGAIHYLEHIMISPDNTRFAFSHRWKTNDGSIYSRLYTANISGNELYLVNDSGRMSHYCWNSHQQIFGWGGIANPINTLRKYKIAVKFLIKPLLPLYKKLVSGNAIDGTSIVSSLVTGDSYILFDDEGCKKEKIPLNSLDRDGHPSFCPIDENYIITDTYPNKKSVAQLILFNIKTKKTILLDTLKSISKFDNSSSRCDLHPKWSFNGKYISIDTMDNNVRSIYLYDIAEVLNKSE